MAGTGPQAFPGQERKAPARAGRHPGILPDGQAVVHDAFVNVGQPFGEAEGRDFRLKTAHIALANPFKQI